MAYSQPWVNTEIIKTMKIVFDRRFQKQGVSSFCIAHRRLQIWYNSRATSIAAKVAEAGLWRGGEKSNAPRKQCSIKAASRSTGILPLFTGLKRLSSFLERHVSVDAPSWAHFLFMYPRIACGRATVECMDWKCALFHAREAVSATTGSADNGAAHA